MQFIVLILQDRDKEVVIADVIFSSTFGHMVDARVITSHGPD